MSDLPETAPPPVTPVIPPQPPPRRWRLGWRMIKHSPVVVWLDARRLWIRRGMLGLIGLSLALATLFVAWPLPPSLLAREAVVSLRYTDRSGRLLRELRSREDGRSVPLPAGPPPTLLVQAFLAAEDGRFYQHPGVDPLAVARAVGQNLRGGRVVSGASTLSQQLARRLKPHSRSLVGKLGEMLWALRLTAHLPRDTILLEYLNRVPLGNSLYGVEAASAFYFNRPAARLSPLQAAVLAGMACAPARNDPYRHPERATARGRQVLKRLAARAGWGKEELRVALEAPLDLAPADQVFGAPHLLNALSRELPALGLDRAVKVETTLEADLQWDVERLVREELAALAERNVGQAAVLVIDNSTGDVLAYVGSKDFLDEEALGQNDGVRSLRQPGSALKPFAYGLALASGRTPADVLSDVEVHMATPTGDYVPQNYDRRVHGPVRLRAALANSYNVPAVRLAEALGPERVLDLLRRAGFASLSKGASHYGVGIVLGDGDVTLRELARAFRGLAQGGVVGPLREVRAAWDAHGKPLPIRLELAPRRFLPPAPVALLTDILSDERARAPAFGLDNALRLPFPVAVKTGTSRAYVDNWTVGFTRERTVATWAGNFNGESMRGVSGITGAGPIFRRVMMRAMRGISPAPLVDRSRFESADICPLSGERLGPACPGVLHEVFLPGSAPKTTCRMHRFSGGSRPQVVTDVGPAFYAWARGEGLDAGPFPAGGQVAPGGAAREARGGQGGAGADGLGEGGEGVRLILPGDGDEYLLEPGIPVEDQSIAVRVSAPPSVERLELRVQGRTPIPLRPPYSSRVALPAGHHRVELWAPGGNAPLAVARIVVR